MTTKALDLFVREIMDTKANTTSMGGASTGVLGVTDTAEQTLHLLKKSALLFATEYRKDKPNKTVLSGYAGDIEGALQTLLVFSAIGNDTFEHCVSQLDALVKSLKG
ncbi:MAG: hypothetical protein JWO35_860 [Candidatus Saccharibacteria bacterium]|nr:hypothetical protein [Candidatus Saccharibacteria bacterium]